MSWADVERDLGVKGPEGAQKKISQMWDTIIAARGLVRWLNDPSRADPAQVKYVNAFIGEREKDLEAAVARLDNRP